MFQTSSSIVFLRIFGPSIMPAMTQRPREKWTTAHFSCLLLYFTQLASYKSQQRGGGYSFWIFLKIFDSYFVPVTNWNSTINSWRKRFCLVKYLDHNLQTFQNVQFEKNKTTKTESLVKQHVLFSNNQKNIPYSREH